MICGSLLIFPQRKYRQESADLWQICLRKNYR